MDLSGTVRKNHFFYVSGTQIITLLGIKQVFEKGSKSSGLRRRYKA